MQRPDVASTLRRRCVYVMCPLGVYEILLTLWYCIYINIKRHFYTTSMINVKHHVYTTSLVASTQRQNAPSEDFRSDCANALAYLNIRCVYMSEFTFSGPKVIKLFSCSTQLSMKFHLVIKIKMLTIKTFFMLNSAEHAQLS